MSKQVDKIIAELTKTLVYKESFEKVIKKYLKNENEFEIINLIIKELSNKGYVIDSIDPLIIKEV